MREPSAQVCSASVTTFFLLASGMFVAPAFRTVSCCAESCGISAFFSVVMAWEPEMKLWPAIQ